MSLRLYVYCVCGYICMTDHFRIKQASTLSAAAAVRLIFRRRTGKTENQNNNNNNSSLAKETNERRNERDRKMHKQNEQNIATTSTI